MFLVPILTEARTELIVKTDDFIISHEDETLLNVRPIQNKSHFFPNIPDYKQKTDTKSNP